MTHFAANLLAGVTFIAFTEAVNATEPREHSATPEILSSVNFAGYKSLSDIEMAEVTGGVIPSGIYNITGSNSNGTPYTGTANLSPFDPANPANGMYYIIYMTSDNPQLSHEGFAFEFSNALSVLTNSGTNNQQTVITYILNPNGSLSGRRWIGPNFVSATETLTPKP